MTYNSESFKLGELLQSIIDKVYLILENYLADDFKEAI